MPHLPLCAVRFAMVRVAPGSLPRRLRPHRCHVRAASVPCPYRVHAPCGPAVVDTAGMDAHAPAHPRSSQATGLVRCTHPKQSVLLGLAVGVAAALSGRPAREALVAGAAVLVAQLLLGLVNDVVDERADIRSGAAGKPVAEGDEIGRASCRERGEIPVVAGSLTKK